MPAAPIPYTYRLFSRIIWSSIIVTPVAFYIYQQRRASIMQGNSNNASTMQGKNIKCRWRLDDSTSSTFTVPDGRKVGYAEYGSPTGRVVFSLHGLPGSRLEAASWEDILNKHDARMIAVDRPGIGWSSPQPDRTILDHAKDVEHLAEHLKIDKYVVMGASAGGPYALACAASMPADKLKGVSVLCGMGMPDMSKRGMGIQNRFGYTVGYRYFPWLARWYFSHDPVGRLDLDDEKRLELTVRKHFNPGQGHPKDREWTKDVETRDDLLRVTMRSCRESFGQGFDGVLLDGKLISSDFGFRLEDVRPDLPVQLWYGTQDVLVAHAHGTETAARLGDRARLWMLDETHSSLIVNHKESMLVHLLECFSG